MKPNYSLPNYNGLRLWTRHEQPRRYFFHLERVRSIDKRETAINNASSGLAGTHKTKGARAHLDTSGVAQPMNKKIKFDI